MIGYHGYPIYYRYLLTKEFIIKKLFISPNVMSTLLKIVMRTIWILLISLTILGFWIFIITKSQIFSFDNLEYTTARVILIPWAWIYGQHPWLYYKERLDQAIALKQQFPELKIIVSADNSRANYNETKVWFQYLLDHKITTGDIFLDFAGFDTYDSIYRAKAIFQAEKLIIVSQEFALPRALFIANQLKIPAIWVIAGSGKASFRNLVREKLSNLKALYETTFTIKPHFLWWTIPLDWTSNSRSVLSTGQGNE